MSSMFQIGDRVRNGSLIGTIIEVRNQPSSALGTVYLIKYDIKSIKRLHNRKLWSCGLGLKKIED